MDFKNLKIGTQLKLGFVVMLILIIVLGTTSFIQSYQIYQQVEKIYKHPFAVQNAIGELRANVLSIHRDIKDLVIESDEKEIAQALIRINDWETHSSENITVLYSQYLGPKSDVDSVKKAFIAYNSVRLETLRLLRAGNVKEAAARTHRNGIAGTQVEVILKAINKLDVFSEKKALSLYTSSKGYYNVLANRLIILVSIFLVVTLLINFLFLRSIRNPLIEITDVSKRLSQGDMNVRILYNSGNEFGELSTAFNAMADVVQSNAELSEKTSNLSDIMLSEDDAHRFFHSALNALMLNTDSNMAAIYLQSDDKKRYEHFDSIGMDNNARMSFAAESFEGEFGLALTTRKVQSIKNIPADTQFIHNTVTGKFIPHEIITIPVLAGNEVIAVISIAGLRTYSKQSLKLIESIHDTLNARVEGVLAYRKMKGLLERLEVQNAELETQKTEMSMQAIELTEQNQELEMQKKQLGEANRLKTNFLSNMSHELRTPLNSVIALSGVLNRRLASQIPEEEYSYLEVIERNGKHLLDLINDILDISRIEAGREEIEITSFNPCNLINEVVSMIMPQAKQKHIKLLVNKNDCGFFITSDAGKCRQILQNLVSNAVKFTEKGKVEIAVTQKGDKFEIVVSDTGIGISEDHLVHIFDEFRQADSSTSRKFGGTGLGLAIAKKYANLLGGTILVKSVLDKGSEFTLTMPITHTEENKGKDILTDSGISCQTKYVSEVQNADIFNKTILLVEDSEPAIIQIKDFLEESGYVISVARDGAEALDVISQTIPAAIILDLMMPGMDGFEVLRTIREAEPTASVPVLILTAKHITKEDLTFLKRNNVHQLIQKGDVNRSELLKAVETMVSSAKIEESKPIRHLQVIEGKPVVLVVEDNPDNMTTVKALLSDKYTVYEAVNGKESIEMAVKYSPNLILMDIALPGMDGIEAFKAIRRDTHLQHIAVIALTASAMTSDRETILSFGFDAYIAKPIDEQLFYNTIKQVLYGM